MLFFLFLTEISVGQLKQKRAIKEIYKTESKKYANGFWILFQI